MHPIISVEAETAAKIAHVFMAFSVSLRRHSRFPQCGWSWVLAGARPLLHHVENRGHEKDSDQAGSEHAADHRRAHDLASNRPGSSSRPKRDATKNEGERGHQTRPQP